MPADGGPRPAGGLARITIESDPLAVREALQRLFSSLLLRGLGDDERDAAHIVLAEVLNNVVEHAYAGGAGKIELSLELGNDRLTCQIADTGAPMPEGRLPLGKTADLDTLPEGGFGWALIRQLARDLEYRRGDGVNLLRFRLPTHAGQAGDVACACEPGCPNATPGPQA